MKYERLRKDFQWHASHRGPIAQQNAYVEERKRRDMEKANRLKEMKDQEQERLRNKVGEEEGQAEVRKKKMSWLSE